MSYFVTYPIHIMFSMFPIEIFFLIPLLISCASLLSSTHTPHSPPLCLPPFSPLTVYMNQGHAFLSLFFSFSSVFRVRLDVLPLVLLQLSSVLRPCWRLCMVYCTASLRRRRDSALVWSDTVTLRCCAINDLIVFERCRVCSLFCCGVLCLFLLLESTNQAPGTLCNFPCPN